MDPDRSLGLYLKYLRYEKNLTANSIGSYKKDIKQLGSYLESRDIKDMAHMDLSVFRGFVRRLDEKKYANRTIIRKYSSLINYFRFLEENRIIDIHLSQFINAPRKRQRYYNILSMSEMRQVLDHMETGKPADIRDRLLMELIYSTGARVSEVEGVMLDDINMKKNEIKVRGKGRKERIVYINSEALYWLDTYLGGARQSLSFSKGRGIYSRDRHLFLNSSGRGLTARSIRNIVKKNVRLAGISKNITPHSLRHSFATHLLQRGAGIREIQELLGHENISTTSIYSHMDISRLRKDYKKFHPRAG
jgi:integrase/recombinase XerD